MKESVLVAYASKYGTTAEIAEKIAQTLTEEGIDVDLKDIKTLKSIKGYRAVVFGSAAYIFRWRPEAIRFIKKHKTVLAAMPVWTFSSGPLEEGDALATVEGWAYPKNLQTVMETIQPKEAVVFHGALQMDKLNFMERWMMQKFPVKKHDFRDWDLIRDWAVAIAESLKNDH